MLNGIHCRGEGTDCPVANPPLPGSGAPEGFQDYYLRDNEDGNYTAVLTEANVELHLAAKEFNLAFAGASPTSATWSSPPARRSPRTLPKSPAPKAATRPNRTSMSTPKDS